MKIYSNQELKEQLISISGWVHEASYIKKEFVFNNFKQALGFIVQVGLISEHLNHHAEIWNVYNKVTLKLSTHDSKAITSKDTDMAILINELMK